tara:strand:- start:1 stop:204 length:204 start_codon:yes stop_codon:yes gene_type:complete
MTFESIFQGLKLLGFTRRDISENKVYYLSGKRKKKEGRKVNMLICPRCYKEIIEGKGHICQRKELKK